MIAFPGETLAAGAPVVSLLPPQNIFVRFFIPSRKLARVHVGDKVAISCDNCPGDLDGTISFIAPQAEYTPPFIYSERREASSSFLPRRARRRREATLLNPGQPVTVRPLEDAP